MLRSSVSDSNLPFEITPADVKSQLDSRKPILLIDVRTPEEHAIARIEGSELIPMDTIPQSLGLLEQRADEETLVLYCHHGIRSANVVNWLRGQGLSACQSLAGGIDRWSTDVDSTVPRY
jgi:rhodanese-related sulfurtransferase